MNISEECYNDIIDLVEQHINKDNVRSLELARLQKRGQELMNSGATDKVRQTADGKSVIGAPDVANELNSIKKRIQELKGNQGGIKEALLDLIKPKKKKEISPKMLELRDRILKANRKKEPPKQKKEKIEVPKITVQGVFGEAIELTEAMIHEMSKELTESLIDEAISILEKVTVSRWKQAAKKVLKDRKQKGWGTDIERDIQRELHADEVAELPDSNISANRVLNAAKKVTKKRNNDYLQVDNKGYRYGTSDQQNEHARLAKRADKSYNLSHKN